MEHTGFIMTAPQDFVVTHELAHEWWYALIGDDQAQEPWLDEAFASYAEEAAGAQPLRVVQAARPRHRHRHARHRLLPRAPLRRLRPRLRRGRLPARRAAQAHGRARASARPCARTPTRNRYGWSTGAEFRAAMDAASPVALGDLWRRYRVG